MLHFGDKLSEFPNLEKKEKKCQGSLRSNWTFQWVVHLAVNGQYIWLSEGSSSDFQTITCPMALLNLKPAVFSSP